MKGGDKMEVNYGIKLLEFRAKHLLSQTRLAEILGVGINMVHRYESGKNEPSNVNKLIFEKKMKEWEKNGKQDA
jgi:transcriptional regulator with XRE-family HTH domain